MELAIELNGIDKATNGVTFVAHSTHHRLDYCTVLPDQNVNSHALRCDATSLHTRHDCAHASLFVGPVSSTLNLSQLYTQQYQLYKTDSLTPIVT
jgi:hypothetical protein